jgi:3-hydroxyacyl-CoA dehydrogenase
VVVTDKNEDILNDFVKRVGVFLSNHGKTHDVSCSSCVDERIRTTKDLSEVARCDWVIESVFEDPMVKFEVLGQLEPKLGRESIISSNTSTIAIERLSARLADPSRFCGFHFFLPVSDWQLVEIIPGPKSHSKTVASAIGFAETLDRIPLVVKDGPGFLANRLMASHINGAMDLLLDGCDLETIEAVAVDLGMTMGPFRLLDEVGLDTALRCGLSLAGESEQLMFRSPILVGMVKAKQLGRKTGSGFYSYADAYDTTGKLCADGSVRDLIEYWAKPAKGFSDATIRARLIMPVVVEAMRLLETGQARNSEQVDLAATLGFGFPISRSGVLHWADILAQHVSSRR